MPKSDRYPDSPVRRQRRRRTHQRIDSYGEAALRTRERDERGPLPPSPSKTRAQRAARRESREATRYSNSNSTQLSSDQLAKLDRINRKLGWEEYDGISQRPGQDQGEDRTQAELGEEDQRRIYRQQRRPSDRRYDSGRNHISQPPAENRFGDYRTAKTSEDFRPYDHNHDFQPRDYRRSSGQPMLERNSAYDNEKVLYLHNQRNRHGHTARHHDEEAKRRRSVWMIRIGLIVLLLVLIVAVPAAVVVSKKHKKSTDPTNTNIHGVSPSSIPKWAQGGYLDPFDWYDTTDFNLTFTNATVGGLYVMGLNSSWNDNTRANDNVPPLSEKWNYGTLPYRGVNLGGWLSIEPFITPSLFSSFDSSAGVVDEWTLSKTLGPTKARETIEKHYSAWVQESTFAEIQAAGFDHVRIPFSYWAVTTYEGDPYVPMISWRYLLRGIEWARKYGLRINLDLHGAPGSQNGWNHSGHQGLIGWLNGTDGDLNAQRTIDVHKQLSTFFSQPRYQNIITMYGLVNEPRMDALPHQKVLNWSANASAAIRASGYDNLIIIGDGFLGLQNWHGLLPGIEGLVLDAHQYLIFDTSLLGMTHEDKLIFSCRGWAQQTTQSVNKASGFGPTMFGEWSQADTDCTQYLNDVGVGSRWQGTLNEPNTPGGSSSGVVLTPSCPTHNNPPCSCAQANADPSTYSAAYKQWLLMFAESQMDSFELGWGWFYWTWETESAAQWSYKDGLAAGILPKLAYERSWNCNMSIPAYGSDVLPETY
ncbi:glycoside hydrolase superfamily [Neohortaea acidophila]|uniref:glucan 1,3-beta-glucosidase n=1 Tax=Neohortaea acidophila TaxID=245834 RepID=A0A6A6PT32_9PEZI|nr:glycoside hydrolase superfamily [Neohortaea acidophila]KAF2482387.1 glycoside hydrolase superfamily [Neohortaea acidophila]